MRVIARSTLLDFVRNRVVPAQQAVLKAQLDAWYRSRFESQVEHVPAELKAQLASASILTSERVVFNIKGNDYRLVASINYVRQVLFVKWLGTHKEYDRVDAKKVDYDEDRYLG